MFHENLKTMRKAKGYTQEERKRQINTVYKNISSLG